MLKEIEKHFRNVFNQVNRVPEATLFKPMLNIHQLPKHIVTSVQFVYDRVKDILFFHRSWVESEIEPPVTEYIGSIEGQINSSNNPEAFSKAATLAKEKEMINQAYCEMRSNLTPSDIQKLDALVV